MILDAKQTKHMDFISSRQKNGDIIVKFDHECNHNALHNDIPNMRYVGRVASLPTSNASSICMEYSNGVTCRVGDVVFYNGCHYVLAKTHVKPYVTWVNLDTSEFEFKSLTKLQYDLSSVSSVVSSLQISCDAIPSALVNPDGKDGYILTLDSENQLVWKALSSNSSLSDVNQCVQLGARPSDVVVWPNIQPGEQTQVATTVTPGYIVGIQTSEIDSNKPEIYATPVSISSIQQDLIQTSAMYNALVSQLSTIVSGETKTIGQLKNSLQNIFTAINNQSKT